MDDDWEWVDTGAPDTSLMESARTVAEAYEPLVIDSEFDNPINPAEVRLHVADGIRADSSRFDNTWTSREDVPAWSIFDHVPQCVKKVMQKSIAIQAIVFSVWLLTLSRGHVVFAVESSQSSWSAVRRRTRFREGTRISQAGL